MKGAPGYEATADILAKHMQTHFVVSKQIGLYVFWTSSTQCRDLSCFSNVLLGVLSHKSLPLGGILDVRDSHE